MTDTLDRTKRHPRFNIIDPNPLLGNRAILIFDPEMSRSLCELIEGLAEQEALSEDQKHLYALAKRLRAHYHKTNEMFSQRDRGESFASSKDEAVTV